MLFVNNIEAICITVLAAVVGACMGSFLNNAALRRHTGESVLHGRSHCPACRHDLGARELVPVFSWLLQRGRCCHCGAKISARYPVTELVCGLAFALVVWSQAHSTMGLSPRTVELLILLAILFYVSLVDIDSRTVPDACIVTALVVHLVYIVVAGPLLGIADAWVLLRHSLIGGLAIFLPMLAVVLVADRIFKRDSMGGGDLKLFLVAGVYFGWEQCLFLIMIACIIGIVWGLVVQARAGRQGGRTQAFPFGPSIALACLIIMVVGNHLVLWYAGLF